MKLASPIGAVLQMKLLAPTTAITCLLCLFGPAQVRGAVDPSISVAVFDDPHYVDTTSGGVSPESDNVQASLTNLGFSVITFTDIIAAASSNLVLLFPEFEIRSLAQDLTVAQRAALSNFVANGGLMVVPRLGREDRFLYKLRLCACRLGIFTVIRQREDHLLGLGLVQCGAHRLTKWRLADSSRERCPRASTLPLAILTQSKLLFRDAMSCFMRYALTFLRSTILSNPSVTTTKARHAYN
jgi:hypothetical protein